MVPSRRLRRFCHRDLIRSIHIVRLVARTPAPFRRAYIPGVLAYVLLVDYGHSVQFMSNKGVQSWLSLLVRPWATLERAGP